MALKGPMIKTKMSIPETAGCGRIENCGTFPRVVLNDIFFPQKIAGKAYAPFGADLSLLLLLGNSLCLTSYQTEQGN